MFIAQLDIKGFRGISTASIRMGPNAVLLGPNNVGKTAIIEAITLLLGRNRLFRALGEFDFFGGAPTASSRISVSATITGFNSHNHAELPEFFNMMAATPLWWHRETGRIYTEANDDRQLAMEIGFSARFDFDDLEVETIRYFVEGDGDPFQDVQIKRMTRRHRQIIGYYLLPAYRTWDRTLSFGSDLFRKVVDFQDALPTEEIIELRNWLRQTPIRIEDSDSLRSIIDRVNQEFSGYVGEEETNLKFLPTTTDISGVLDAVYPFLDGKSGTSIPVGRHGSGVVSLQTLLLLLEFGRARHTRGENFILAAEEPELHLHPGHHRRLVSRMRGVSSQTIITTHSPEIAAYHSPHEIIILSSREGDLESTPLLPLEMSVPDKNALLRLYTVYRTEICEALMHRVVVMPEGITEYHWFKKVMKACITAEGWTSTGSSDLTRIVGILPTQDSSVLVTHDHFSRLSVDLIPLVDGDSEGDRYVNSLVNAERPPSHILRLDSGMSLENLIAWFLAADSALNQEISAILSSHNIECAVGTDLGQLLRAAEVKTRWDIHEAIAGALGGSSESSARTRRFFNSINVLAAGSGVEDEIWEHDVNLSTETTTVWTLKVT